MNKHKFFFLSATVSLLLAGCSSSNSDPVYNTETNCDLNKSGYGLDSNGTCSVCDFSTHELNSSGYCVIKLPTQKNNCELNISGYGLDSNNVCSVCDLTTNEVNGTGYCVTKTTNPTQTKRNYYYLSGVAVDGYLSGSDVKLDNEKVLTNDKGSWTLRFEGNKSTSKIKIVQISGGTDTATGERFEGQLSAVVEQNSFAVVTVLENIEPIEPESKNIPLIPVTPLTTLVAKLVEANNSITKEEASKTIAKALGVDEGMLSKDPIETLKNGTDPEKTQASQAIKQALIVQKMAESLSKSVIANSSDTEFSTVFNAVISTVAKIANSGTNAEINIANILESEDFTKKITDNIQKADEKASGVTSSKANLDKFAKMLAKMKSAEKTVSKLVTILATLKIESFANLESAEKTTEVITKKLEADLSKIANATTEAEIDSLVESAEKTADAIGKIGIQAIQAHMTELINKAEDNQFINLDTVTNLLLSNEVINNPDKAKDIDLSSALQLKIAPEFSIDGSTSAKTGETLSFSANVTNSDKLSYVTYNWTINGSNVGSSSTLSHKFDSSGTFAVSLTISANSLTETKSLNVVIAPKDVSLAPDISIFANYFQTYPNRTVIFNVTSTIPNTTYSWNIDEIAQNTDSDTFNYVFTTVGTHTISVTGTANGVSSIKTILITVIAEPVTTPDTDGLALAENKVTFGITNKDLNRTVILNNGSFGIVNYSAFEVSNVESEDFIMSLRLTNSFEANDKKVVTIGMKIVDNSNKVIFAVIPNVTLNYNDNQFSVDTNSSSTLYGYGKKSNGTPISTEVSDLDFSRVITTNSNQILSLNHTKLVDLIYDKISSSNDTLAQRFFSQDGNYTMSLYVSGLDSFDGFKADTNKSLVSPFSGDLSNNISNKFDLAKLYSLSGNIRISKLGVINDINAEINKSRDLNISSAFSQEALNNATKNFTMDCNQSNIAKINSTTGVINIFSTTVKETSCQVTFEGAGGIVEESEDFLIKVTDANNPAPQFIGTISSTTQYSGTDLNILTSSYFSDVNDTLNYSLNCFPTNVTINSSTGLISGTFINNNNDPVNSACKVTATDSIGQTATSNEFNIIVNPLGAPQLSAIKIADNNFTGYSNKDFNLSVDGNITPNSSISYTWFNGLTNVGTGTTYNFKPNKSGNYPIKVIASANNKNTTKEQNITVLNTNPVITASSFPSSCEVNKVCVFNVSVNDVDLGDVLSYVWEINRTNKNVNSKDFLNTFSTTGEYNVSVEVNDGTINGVALKSQTVSVVQAPTDPLALLTGDTNLTVNIESNSTKNVSFSTNDGYINSNLIINFKEKSITSPDISGEPILIKISNDVKVVINPDALYEGSVFTVADTNTGIVKQITYNKALADQFLYLE